MSILHVLLKYFAATQDRCITFDDVNTTCPASALHAITAAMATQGYWVQADLLYFLEYTNFQTWAILIYTLAVASGIFGMALGMPPKMYVWFFVGPGVFHWLIADTVPMQGVRWNIGPVASNANAPDLTGWMNAQREVWKLAEVGLANTNIAKRGDFGFSANNPPVGGNPAAGFRGDGTVEVSQFFSYFDRLLSNFTDWCIGWTGLYYLATTQAFKGGTGSGDITNLPTTGMDSKAKNFKTNGTIESQNWLLSNLKWEMVESITGAKLSSGDLRDAFVTFMASECGDAFTSAVDEGKFIAASNSKGLSIPDSIFIKPLSLLGLAGDVSTNYIILTQELVNQSIPTPSSLKRFLDKGGQGSFRESVAFLGDTEAVQNSGIMDDIRCDQYLYLLTHAFRWEAGHTYYQLVASMPAGFSPAALSYAMLYGWAVKQLDSAVSGFGYSLNLDSFQALMFGQAPSNGTQGLTADQQMRFIQDLILVHLWRNEMALAPMAITPRKTSAQEGKNFVEAYQRSTGSKSKFGEVYSFALLMPYVQGCVMYFLAIAYPICCMMVLVPGWHKIIFTWMTFWAWVKLWDVGFAITLVIERTVWAMVGNSANAERVFSKVLLMQDLNGGIGSDYGSHVVVQCNANLNSGLSALASNFSTTLFQGVPYGVCSPETVPTVYTSGTTGIPGSIGSLLSFLGIYIGSFETWLNSLNVMDRALTIGASIDLDLSNSYYIYVMSALYFAVPAVTGQIVLGAKAAAAGLATSAVSGLASEGGRASGQGFTGDISNRARANQSTIGQTAYAKEMRGQAGAGGFASQALDLGNAGLKNQAMSSYSDGVYSGQGAKNNMNSKSVESAIGALSSGTGTAVAAAQVVGALGQRAPGNTVRAAPGSTESAPSGPTGTGPTGTGPTGTGPTGAGQQQVSSSGQSGAATGSRWASTALSSMGSVAQLGRVGLEANEKVGGAQYGEFNRQQQAIGEGLQSQARMDSLGFGMAAQGFNNAAGKASAGAEYKGKEAEYEATRNFANQVGGTLSAMGAGGAVSVGNKPMGLEGMAMAGQLGKSMKRAAEWSGGEYQSFVAGKKSQLDQNYGREAITGTYRPADPQTVMQAKAGAFTQGFDGNAFRNTSPPGVKPAAAPAEAK